MAKSFAEKFRPLTHVEIVGDKPLRVKIGDTKWYYTHRLMRAIDFARFFDVKDGIIKLMTDAVERKRNSPMQITGIDDKIMFRGAVMMAGVLYEIAEKPKGIISRFRFKRAFFNHYLEHIDELFQLFEHCLSYNGRLLRFTPVPPELQTVAGSRVSSDGFLTLCGESVGAHLEPWILLCERLEHKKQSVISEYFASKDQQRKNRVTFKR